MLFTFYHSVIGILKFYAIILSTSEIYFVCLLTGLCKNYSTDFCRIRCKCGMWAMEELIH